MVHDVDRPEFERYEIEELIGLGARGQVYRARDRASGTPVALKLLDLPSDDQARQRLLRALNRVLAIQHPNVVRHYAVAPIDAGRALVAMEWVSTQKTLENVLAEGWRPSLREALRLAAAAAAGLAAVHAAGVIHRDIKPENLLMAAGPERLKVADFGLAIPSDEPLRPAPERLTGTAAFLAPELADGSGEWSPKSDLYALGCVLFQLLTGRLPYEAGSEMEMLYLHARGPVPDPAVRDSAVGQQVRELVRRLLAKQPEERYSSANRLAAELARLADG